MLPARDAAISEVVVDKWQLRRRPDSLNATEVHLWVASLTLPGTRLSYFESILSRDEKERAHRFKKTQDAERYMAARGSLRSLLGSYLGRKPEQLRFAYDALGKPRLAEETALPLLNFSVSHCDELALFGFVWEHRIGVDLEFTDREIDFEDLATRYFSSNEVGKLRSSPPNQQRETFYRGWTRKEAFLKARGEGLSYPLEQVEVSLGADEPARVLKVTDDPDASQRWMIEHLTPAPGYIGAVAVETTNFSFAYARLESE